MISSKRNAVQSFALPASELIEELGAADAELINGGAAPAVIVAGNKGENICIVNPEHMTLWVNGQEKFIPNAPIGTGVVVAGNQGSTIVVLVDVEFTGP